MGPDCDRAYTLPTGSLQRHLIAGIATSPAARAGILICAAGAMSSHQKEPLKYAALYGLRGYAISCIQAAVRNPNTRHSDHTALAVAALRIFEMILGCEEASKTHLQGVACIRDARGASLHWVLDGVLSWMATLRLPQITKGTFTILDQPRIAA
jgi:hypothetical protein